MLVRGVTGSVSFRSDKYVNHKNTKDVEHIDRNKHAWNSFSIEGSVI